MSKLIIGSEDISRHADATTLRLFYKVPRTHPLNKNIKRGRRSEVKSMKRTFMTLDAWKKNRQRSIEQYGYDVLLMFTLGIYNPETSTVEHIDEADALLEAQPANVALVPFDYKGE